MTYEVTLSYSVSSTITIEADSEEEALEKAKENIDRYSLSEDLALSYYEVFSSEEEEQE